MTERHRPAHERRDAGSPSDDPQPGADKPNTDVPPTSDRAYRIAFWILDRLFDGYIHTEVHGRHHLPDPGHPTIVAINHTSALDFAAGYVVGRPGYFAIKREAIEFPVTGRFLRAIGGIPIRRDQKDMDALREMRSVLKAGHVLGIAPEGTRSRDGRVGRFDEGFVWLASRTGASVVPCALHGAHRLLPRGTMVPRRGQIWAAMGPPVDYEDEGGRIPRQRMQELADGMRERVLDLLRGLVEESGVRSPALTADGEDAGFPPPRETGDGVGTGSDADR